MKITDERKENMKEYGALSRGDVFIHDEHVYIKTYTINVDDDEENTYNATDLEDGDLTYFANEDLVEPLDDIELIIRG